MSGATLSVALLGRVEIALDGNPIDGFGYAKVRALLVYLAMESGHPHSRTVLAALLWPDMPERAARQNLSQALSTLRHALGERALAGVGSLLLATADTVRLNPSSTVAVDAAKFLGLITACDTHAHHSSHTCALCFERLQEALGLYRGDYLAEFSVPDSAPFEEWALLQREHVRQRAFRALERLAQAAEWRGVYERAIAFTQQLLELEPLLEAAQRELMRLMALNGETASALAHYDQFKRSLAAELQAAPEDDTVALFNRIRDGQLEGLRRSVAPSFNGPTPPSPLIGRSENIRAVSESLRASEVRALTITGAGGVGKTRLALESAIALRFDFEDGAHVVDLAPLSDPALIPSVIIRTLNLKEQKGKRPASTLLAHLREKHLLLVLDNCEHLLPAGSQNGELPSLIARLLAVCSALKILITSRTPLHIRAERLYTLTPLSEADAVQLFIARANAVQAGFELTSGLAAIVAEICRRLDCLPLAIELIAARARTNSAAELLAQLERPLEALVSGPRDAPERHHTLRNAIAWSHDRLNAPEQRVFAHLGVFAGGCTARGVQAVAGADLTVQPLLEVLHACSLVRVQMHAGDTRFGLLETIRAYARERLEARGELEAACRRHADYYLALAERAAPELEGPAQALWLECLEQDHDNLRAAWAWCRAAETDSALRMAVALGKFWEVRGYLAEGRHCLMDALDRDLNAALPLRGAALDQAGILAYRQGDYDGACRLHNQSLSIWRDMDNGPAIARTLRRLGIVSWEQGHTETALSHYEQSLQTARAAGDVRSIAGALNSLGSQAVARADYGMARVLYEESLSIYRELSDKAGTAHVLNNLGAATWEQLELPAAHSYLAEGLTLCQEIGHKWSAAMVLINLGNVARSQSDFASARAHFQQSMALYQELGDTATISYPLLGLGEVAYDQGDYLLARSLFCRSLRLRHEAGEMRPVPRNLEAMAQLASVEGRPECAARLFGAADALLESLGAARSPRQRAQFDDEPAALRAALGDEVFERAWAAGRAMTVQNAVAVALDPRRDI